MILGARIDRFPRFATGSCGIGELLEHLAACRTLYVAAKGSIRKIRIPVFAEACWANIHDLVFKRVA